MFFFSWKGSGLPMGVPTAAQVDFLCFSRWLFDSRACFLFSD